MKFNGNKAREIRKKKYLSSEYTAIKLGVTRRTLWTWESGRIIPNELTVRKLADILSIDVSEISDLPKSGNISNDDLREKAKFFESSNANNRIDPKLSELLTDLTNIYNESKENKYIINALLSVENTIFYIKNSRGQYVVGNKYFKRLLGLHDDIKLAGKTDKDILPQKEALENNEQDMSVIQNKKSITNYNAYLPGTRKKMWGLFSRWPLYDINNKISGVAVSAINITDQIKESKKNELFVKATANMGFCLWVAFLNKNNKYSIAFHDPKKADIILGNFKDSILSEERISKQINNLVDSGNQYLVLEVNIELEGVKHYFEEILYKQDNKYYGLLRNITDLKDQKSIIELITKAFDEGKDGLFLRYKNQNRFAYISKSIARFYGYPIENFYNDLNFWLNNCLHPDERKRVLSYRNNNSWPYRYITKCITSKGEIKYVEQRTYEGEDYYLNFETDITDQLERENINKNLMLSLDSSDDAVFLKNKELNKYIYVSKSVEKIYGYSLNKFYDDGYFWLNNCISPEYKELELQYREKKSWPKTYTYKIITSEGQEKRIESRVFDSKNYFLNIEKDITGKKSRNRRDDLLLKCLNSIDSTIQFTAIYRKGFKIDSERYQLYYLNYAYQNITGYSVEDLTGNNGYNFWINNCIHPDDRKKEENFFQNASWPNIRVYRIIHANGGIRYIQSKIVYKEKDGLDFFIETDITETINSNIDSIDKERLKIAKKLLKEGVPIETIEKTTGVSGKKLV